jgi:type VI secretion system protein ImpH
MATASGAPDVALITAPPAADRAELERDLREHPGEFDFFQAVRLLHLLFPDRAPVGTFARPGRESAHFAVNSELAFPPSQIEGIDWSKDPPEVKVNFMGLTGPMGALPYAYSELIAERLRAKDHTLAAFFDIFNHRVISLFYQAWEKHRFAVVFERTGEDRLSHYLLSLVGLGTPGLQARLKVPDQALLFYSGLLALEPRSAVALEAILEDYFGVSVEVEQFVGSWQELAPSDCCALEDGESFNAQLGRTAVVGDAIWDEQSRIRVTLGPLSAQRYLEFLPGGPAADTLRSLVAFFCKDEIEVEFQLVLERGDVPACELGKEGEDGPRLGWFTWMKSRAGFDRDPRDTLLRLA